MRMKSQAGQSVIEYLILVSMLGIGTLAAVRVVSQNVTTRFAVISDKLQGGNPPSRTMDRVEASQTQKKDMSNFFHGASDRE